MENLFIKKHILYLLCTGLAIVAILLGYYFFGAQRVCNNKLDLVKEASVSKLSSANCLPEKKTSVAVPSKVIQIPKAPVKSSSENTSSNPMKADADSVYDNEKTRDRYDYNNGQYSYGSDYNDDNPWFNNDYETQEPTIDGIQIEKPSVDKKSNVQAPDSTKKDITSNDSPVTVNNIDNRSNDSSDGYSIPSDRLHAHDDDVDRRTADDIHQELEDACVRRQSELIRDEIQSDIRRRVKDQVLGMF
jgi:hypothetical protein